MTKPVRRSNHAWKKTPKKPRPETNLRSLWAEPIRKNTPNLIGYFDIERGTIYTQNNLLSTPGGGDPMREVLIGIGKRTPRKAHTRRLEARQRFVDEGRQ